MIDTSAAARHTDEYTAPSQAQRRSLHEHDMQYSSDSLPPAGMAASYTPAIPERSPKRRSFGFHDIGPAGGSGAYSPIGYSAANPAPWDDNKLRRNSSSGSLVPKRGGSAQRSVRWSDQPEGYDAGRNAGGAGQPQGAAYEPQYYDAQHHHLPHHQQRFDGRYGAWDGAVPTDAFGNGYGVGEAL